MAGDDVAVSQRTPRPARRSLTGWGRTSPSTADVVSVGTDEQVAEAVMRAGTRGVVVRGCGRSYGDAAQNGGGTVLDLGQHDAVLDLDPETGRLTVGSGVTLDHLMRTLVPRGWFVPVTPGTRHVSVGGAVASDVHGKNHHVDGSFGQHVTGIDLLTADGRVRHITPADPLFWATVGGMGLTGVILRVTLRMTPVETAYLVVDTDRCDDLDTVMAAMGEDDPYPYSVAWLDCLAGGASLGRSVLTRGRFARRDELTGAKARAPRAFDPVTRVTAPAVVPGGLLNRWSVGAFNEAWFRRAPRHRTGEIQDIGTFFHPLDGVRHWNRIYGPGGFLQYQVLVPPEASDVLRTCVETFSRAGTASFLTVLKRMGPGNPGHLSFPGPGWTLTLDVPARMPGLGALLTRLDELVVGAGGRSYLAKDSRMSPETFRAMYPRLPEWQEIRRGVDPDGTFVSDLARRLQL